MRASRLDRAIGGIMIGAVVLAMVLPWVAPQALEVGSAAQRPARVTPSIETDTTHGATLALRNRFDRAQWGLSEPEWSRYQELMQGVRGAISPATISPIEVLGIHARNDAERLDYARRFAQVMREDTERVLAFARAYDTAWREINPSGKTIDPAQVATTAASPAIQRGDRLLFFTRLTDCPACAPALAAVRQAAERDGLQLDVYLIDATSDDAIRAWIPQQGFNAERIRAGSVTFNHDRGTLSRLGGIGATVPKVIRLRAGSVAAVEPASLL